MPIQCFHKPAGGRDFLGLRTSPLGRTEIVYDDGCARRLVWKVSEGANERQIGDALQMAVKQARVVPALYAELRKRSIAIEAIER
jgi:hypothetical protein